MNGPERLPLSKELRCEDSDHAAVRQGDLSADEEISATFECSSAASFLATVTKTVRYQKKKS